MLTYQNIYRMKNWFYRAPYPGASNLPEISDSRGIRDSQYDLNQSPVLQEKCPQRKCYSRQGEKELANRSEKAASIGRDPLHNDHVKCACHTLLKQAFNGSINPSNRRTIIQSINQSNKQRIEQSSIDQSTKSINQSTDRLRSAKWNKNC